ncbi:hypothetical protein KAR91_22455 [Candidatus Pacearchaeota archaeon]|nr:hypothetical protein [Candidatus Pacearchaeota archaeon]
MESTHRLRTCKLAFVLAKLGMVDGYEHQLDEDTGVREHMVHGPSEGFTFIYDLESYWIEQNRN